MNGYRIEAAHPEHLVALPAVERAAAELFPPDILPQDAREETLPLEELAAACKDGRLWVALAPTGQPVGFAIAKPIDDSGFLVELDVHPDHQRQGLGRRLVARVVDWARERSLVSVSLTTFAQVPWNAPFYERLGFRRLTETELPGFLDRKLSEERHRGLRDRVAMALPLVPPDHSARCAGRQGRA